MSAMVSQITGVTIVYSTMCSGTDQRKHQSSAWLAFVRGIHRWIPRTKGQWRGKIFSFDVVIMKNKTNLRDLIAATGLVILPKLDSNCPFFSPCDLEIWWMTSKNYRAPLLHYIKLCASSQTPQWIQTGVTVQKRSIRVKISDFFCYVWPKIFMDDLEK